MIRMGGKDPDLIQKYREIPNVLQGKDASLNKGTLNGAH
jgi:hypothetical protein